MRITKTGNEIVAIINETVGMAICQVDNVVDIKIDTDNDAEGNVICFHDWLFCGDSFYHYVNQQGMMDDRLDITLNAYSVDDNINYNDKCLNRDGEHDDYCTCSINADDIGVWTFEEDTFNNVLEGLKIALKVKNANPLVILDDDEEFVV